MKQKLEEDKTLFEEVIKKLNHMNPNTNKELVSRVQERLDRVEKLLASIK